MKSFKQTISSFIQSIKVGWFLASRQILRSSKWTTGLIVFIMTLTFLNLVVVSGLLVGLITGSYKQFKEAYSGDILITPRSGREYIENSAQLLEFLKKDTRVVAFSPRHSYTASVLGTLTDNPKSKEKANTGGGVVVGIDPTLEEEVTGFSKFVKYGEALKPSDSGYILFGSNLLKEYSTFGDVDIPGLELVKGIEIGSKVKLTINTASGTPASRIYIVKGILKSKVDQVSQRMFIVDPDFRQFLTTNQWELQEIAVKVESGQEQYLADDIRRFMNGSALRVQTSEEAIPSFLRDIEQTFGILGNALSSIALIVASITVFIVIFINAITRRKFIGIMKGIGVEPRAIKIAYVLQGLFYGVIGSGIGLILTFGLLKPFFDANPIDFPFSDGILVATLNGALVRVGILLVVTILAGYIPATLIVRRNTLDSILGR